jgi:deoxycytidylate deaminase
MNSSQTQDTITITQKCINEVYKQHEHFVVIGLTGRCGSGCSKAREILCEEDFNLNSMIQRVDNKSNSERDFSILLNFAQKNNMFPFQVIKVRDVLTSFIFDNIDSFYKILEDVYKTENPKDKLNQYLTKQYKIKYDKNIVIEDEIEQSKKIWKGLDEDLYGFISEMTKEQYEFLFTGLGKISCIFRDFLRDEIDKDAYTIVYQYVGNAVRTYGHLPNDVLESTQDAKCIFSVAKRINVLIKILRRREWITDEEKNKGPQFKSDVRVVIDSLKNVFEANYLKSRYHSFYLMAITLDDDERFHRLAINKQLTKEKIDLIDLREQPSRAIKELKKEESKYKEVLEEYDFNGIQSTSFNNGTYLFNLQDVDACIQNADILVNNKGKIEDLKKTLLRYACLMMHPGLVSPTDDERFMQIAQAAKASSGCISRQVGAVVCDKNGNLVSIGWNDPSSTIGNECVSCLRRNLGDLCTKDDSKAYSYYELYDVEFRKHVKKIMLRNLEDKKDKDYKTSVLLDKPIEDVYSEYEETFKDEAGGLPFVYCFKDVYCTLVGDKNQVHTRAQHGEEKALEFCDKSKVAGGTLYTTSSSCELCAKKAMSYSISRIVYIEPYSGITNNHILGHEVKIGTEIKRQYNEKGKTTNRIEPIKVELFTGATQRAYDQLYTLIFPMKDELELRGIIIKLK